MSKKSKFKCSSCQELYTKWQGQCPSCNEWNTLEDFIEQAIPSKSNNYSGSESQLLTLDQAASTNLERISSKSLEFDLVLGGGFVVGSSLLFAGDPGIGKSTLLLQTIGNLSDSLSVLYFSGEESPYQISLRAKRIVPKALKTITLSTETDVLKVINLLNTRKPKLIVIDSIQTLYNPSSASSAGSVSQLKDCCQMLTAWAKQNSAILLMIGHMTKEGSIAGPLIMEHIVDGVFMFESDGFSNTRSLRSKKYRFGNSNELALFEMEATGLEDHSGFHTASNTSYAGTAATCTIEGARPLILELQSLTEFTKSPVTKKVSHGVDVKKLDLQLAILSKYFKMTSFEHNVFLNISNGLKISDTAIDLSILAALLSARKDIAFKPKTAFIGETALTGELKPVSNIEKRLSQLSKSGFETIIIPQKNEKQLKSGQFKELNLIGFNHVSDITSLLS